MTQAGQGQSMEASITINNIDKVGPTITTVSFKTSDNVTYTPGNWTKLNITQTLAANDGTAGKCSGVSYFQYSKDSGTATTTTSGATWKDEMKSGIRFRAVDALGNAGAWSSTYYLQIDYTAPVCSGKLSPQGVFYYKDGYDWIGNNQSVALRGITINDNLSGLKSIGISRGQCATATCDKSNWNPAVVGEDLTRTTYSPIVDAVTDSGTEPKESMEVGVWLSIEDNAGNVSECGGVIEGLRLDAVPPQFSDATKSSDSNQIRVKVSDAGSGVDSNSLISYGSLQTTEEGSWGLPASKDALTWSLNHPIEYFSRASVDGRLRAMFHLESD